MEVSIRELMAASIANDKVFDGEKIKKAIEAGDWMEQRAEYGYPDYYFKSFGLNNIKDEK